ADIYTLSLHDALPISDEYDLIYSKFIKVSGEQPEFFSEYKVADAAIVASLHKTNVQPILDFGSGVGNSVPWFRKHFPTAELTCADVSLKSMEIARRRYP